MTQAKVAAPLIAAGCEVMVGQTFTRSTSISLAETPSLFQAFDVVAADLNGDGKPDLAVTCGSSIHVFWPTINASCAGAPNMPPAPGRSRSSRPISPVTAGSTWPPRT
jgi:hypothetical protein